LSGANAKSAANGNRAGMVVVSGLPASGKSSLTERLSADLPALAVRRDALRRAVLDPLSEAVHPTAEQARLATDRLVVAALELTWRTGTVVVDGNFNAPSTRASVDAFVRAKGISAVEVCLWGDPDVLLRRFIERGQPAYTPTIAAYVDEAVGRDREPVLQHSIARFDVDTTSFADLDARYADMVHEIRTLLPR
jgi:predicted kinase